MNVHDVGDLVRVSLTLTDSGGIGLDPGSLSFQHRRELADPLSYSTLVYGVDSITRTSTGVYYTDVSVNTGGTWLYRWNAFGSNQAAVEGQFQVRWRKVG